MDSHAKPRLIDANTLAEKWKSKRDELYAMLKNSDSALRIPEIDAFIESIDSAPTVETTDDMIDSVASVKFEKIVTDSEPFLTMGFYASKGYEIGYGKTPIEAVKKLEEKLNKKK